jgi:futalosine hydrolase
LFSLWLGSYLNYMGYKILLVAATPAEAESANKIIRINDMKGFRRFGDLSIEVLIAGIGSVSTAWSLKHWFDNNTHPDLAINIGIAGSYNDCYKPGDITMPVTDCFADFGIEDHENGFLSIFEAELIARDQFPYKRGWLKADLKQFNNLEKVIPFVKAVTVNMTSGSSASIERIKSKFNPDVETMEGATFFYICAMEKIPFLAVRAISNKVEPRNKSNWIVSMALNNLANRLEDLLLVLK